MWHTTCYLKLVVGSASTCGDTSCCLRLLVSSNYDYDYDFYSDFYFDADFTSAMLRIYVGGS